MRGDVPQPMVQTDQSGLRHSQLAPTGQSEPQRVGHGSVDLLVLGLGRGDVQESAQRCGDRPTPALLALFLQVAVGLGTAAAEAGHRVRYVLASRLVNELAEAENDRALTKIIARYGRVDLLCLDISGGAGYAESCGVGCAGFLV